MSMHGFGWTYLSREALRRAEASLDGGTAGVRDEIGFLLIHQRYADRFFPGTSVLHTRLRYALFVPWMYESLRCGPPIRSAAQAVERAEIGLAGRLLNAGDGVIGGRNFPNPTSQPPSMVYWTALGAWGILRRRPDGKFHSRARVHAGLQIRGRVNVDDDGVPLTAPELPFSSLPTPPSDWDGEGALDFRLKDKEPSFLYQRLCSVVSPADSTRPSLLAQLAVAGTVPVAENCWDAPVAEVATHDRAALVRAGHAAALAAIGRGIYAALVEQLRDEVDRRETTRRHRDLLPGVVERYARSAGRLDLDKLVDDVRELPRPVLDVLEATLDWLGGGAGDPLPLRGVYARAEHFRKGQRARLSDDLNGRERRLEWNNTEHSPAEPLHYRWGNVRRLLADLHGAA